MSSVIELRIVCNCYNLLFRIFLLKLIKTSKDIINSCLHITGYDCFVGERQRDWTGMIGQDADKWKLTGLFVPYLEISS